MTYGMACTEFMLQHIGDILREFPITPAQYRYGDKVKSVEILGDYQFVVVGTVCGCEYFDDGLGVYQSGFFYDIRNIAGYIVSPGGVLKPYVCQQVEKVHESEIVLMTDSAFKDAMQFSYLLVTS